MTTQDILPLVKDQLRWEGLLKNDADMESSQVSDFAFAATSLAKQMMETTKDAATNARTVLGYGLPPTFDDLDDSAAKKMIKRGNFYSIAQKLLEQYGQGELPQPDITDLMSAFDDPSAQAIDGKSKPSCQYTADYMKHMKTLAKELEVKGKNLFHPVRLALTGEMSGQDVTKQLSLLAMAAQGDTVVDLDRVGAVTFDERMKRLRTFCDSVPLEFRTQAKREAHQVENSGKQTTAATDVKAKTTTTSGSPADPMDSYEGPPITALDIRVGHITKVWEHPEADKLYCEEIDIGEDEPRQVASGLRPYLKAEDMEGRLVLVLSNLKARKMVGFPSHGMVLCASNKDHTDVRLVNPPVDAKIGERVTIPDFNFESEEGQPFAENKIGKKKVFEKLAPYLVTNKYGVPEFLGRPFMTSAGVCTSPISDGSVS